MHEYLIEKKCLANFTCCEIKGFSTIQQDRLVYSALHSKALELPLKLTDGQPTRGTQGKIAARSSLIQFKHVKKITGKLNLIHMHLIYNDSLQ